MRVKHLTDLTFLDEGLLEQALTRKGFAIEREQIGLECKHQECLSTLGDGVLRAALVDILIRCGFEKKGDLSAIKQNLENNNTLYKIGIDLSISPETLRVSSNERTILEDEGLCSTAGNTDSVRNAKVTIISDTVEALIGAIYLDLGFRVALGVIECWYNPYLREMGLETKH